MKWTDGKAEAVAPPGTVLEGKRTDLVAAIIQKATGQTIREILHERLIDPMGCGPIQTGWGKRQNILSVTCLPSDIRRSDWVPTTGRTAIYL
ncbi:hypothetical protein [Rossellomorea marisflavi]|uniref:hypothetical protein n=1 Tax=Rossellomorea marisflavi TaxID=189381 RepID=UPI000A7C125F|nr:hypothetical protein [Rossellomorea marisflavi]